MNIKPAILALVLTASSANAQSAQDRIVQQLQDQGFDQITISRTFLGRIRIEAYSDTHERELVFNPNTGNILRDYWEPFGEDGDDDGSSDDDDDDQDDDDDDADEDDDDDDDEEDDDDEDDDDDDE